MQPCKSLPGVMTSMRLVVLGAGGHGKVVADCAELTGKYDSVLFLDSQHPQKTALECWPVEGIPDGLASFVDGNTEFFVAIGNNHARLEWLDRVEDAGGVLATLIHPNAVVSRYSHIAPGTLLLGGAIVNAFSTLSKGCIVNTGASIDHDCTLGDAVHIAPGTRLAGTVQVGKCTFLGVGCAVVPGANIGRDVIIGAGATVISDIPDGVTAVGTPAKVIKSQSQNFSR